MARKWDYISQGSVNILGDLNAIGRVAPAPPTSDIKTKLDQCKALIATAGRGGVDDAKLKECRDFIDKYDPEYAKQLFLAEVNKCLADLKETKYLEDGTTPDPYWEKRKEICRNFLKLAGITIPGEEEGNGNQPGQNTQGSVTLIGLSVIFNAAPLYISIPLTLYTLWHYRRVWLKYVPFNTNK